MLLQQLLHKLRGIEYPIISVVSLDHHSMTLSLPLKFEFDLDSFSSIYSHLVLDAHITTGMVNKDPPHPPPPRTYQMDLIPLLCGRSYLKPARYSDLQTPSVQTEDDHY